MADTFWRPISFDLFPAWSVGRKEAHGGKDWKKEAQERVESDIEAKGIVQRLSAPAAETEVESMRSSMLSLSTASSYTRDSSSTGLSPGILAASTPGGTILSINTPRTGCRAQVMAYVAVGNPRFRTASAWQKNIYMIFEVTDIADNCRLFYGEGPIQVSAAPSDWLARAVVRSLRLSQPRIETRSRDGSQPFENNLNMATGRSIPRIYVCGWYYATIAQGDWLCYTSPIKPQNAMQ